jgi:hypothetical protein
VLYFTMPREGFEMTFPTSATMEVLESPRKVVPMCFMVQRLPHQSQAATGPPKKCAWGNIYRCYIVVQISLEIEFS